MDVYLKVLNWSLDTTKADALLARLPKPRAQVRLLCASRVLLLLLVVGVFVAGTGGAMMVLGKLGHARARSASRSRSCSALLVAYGAGQADRLPRAAWSAAAALPNGTRSCAGALECPHARSSDGDGRRRHRHPAAQRRPVRNPVDVLLPAAELRLFAGQHHAAAGKHAQADRSGGRPASPRSSARIRTSSACSSASTSATAASTSSSRRTAR